MPWRPKLGIAVSLTEAAIDAAGHLFSADYTPRPPRIRLYTRALAAIDRGLAEPGVADIVGTARGWPVLLAHEIYHHLDLARPITLARHHRVTTLKLGPLHLRTRAGRYPPKLPPGALPPHFWDYTVIPSCSICCCCGI